MRIPEIQKNLLRADKILSADSPHTTRTSQITTKLNLICRPVYIATKMRALRYYGHEDIRLDEIPEPQCRPGCIKIKPTYVGICGSDM